MTINVKGVINYVATTFGPTKTIVVVASTFTGALVGFTASAILIPNNNI